MDNLSQSIGKLLSVSFVRLAIQVIDFSRQFFNCIIDSFEVNDKRYDIVEIDRPTCAFLMLEVLNKENNSVKGIHIIKMENKTNIRLVCQL